MKKVKFSGGEVKSVPDIYADWLITNGTAIEVKEEKQVIETKEDKTAAKRQTKDKK